MRLNKGNLKNKPEIIYSWFAVGLCMASIFYTSSIPGKQIPSLFTSQDIFFHFFAYFALCFLLNYAIKNTFLGITVTETIIFVSLLGIIYGMSDEMHQAFVPYRSVSGLDLLVDALGSFVGSIFYPLTVTLFLRIGFKTEGCLDKNNTF